MLASTQYGAQDNPEFLFFLVLELLRLLLFLSYPKQLRLQACATRPNYLVSFLPFLFLLSFIDTLFYKNLDLFTSVLLGCIYVYYMYGWYPEVRRGCQIHWN